MRLDNKKKEKRKKRKIRIRCSFSLFCVRLFPLPLSPFVPVFHVFSLGMHAYDETH